MNPSHVPPVATQWKYKEFSAVMTIIPGMMDTFEEIVLVLTPTTASNNLSVSLCLMFVTQNRWATLKSWCVCAITATSVGETLTHSGWSLATLISTSNEQNLPDYVRMWDVTPAKFIWAVLNSDVRSSKRFIRPTTRPGLLDVHV